MNSIKYNASKLLHANGQEDRFIHKLNVSDDDKKDLLDARKLGRAAIKKAFNELSTQVLLQESLRETGRNLPSYQTITPAFWSQGSFSYGTMNRPAYNPPQQIDLDDGVYLPMDMFGAEPIYSKEIFFKIVDTALQNLATEQGWTFVGDKDTCVRLEINDLSHLDFPLYAMPRKRFEELKEAKQIVLDAVNREFQFSEEAAKIILNPDDVYLARRGKEHWVKSDPKQIENWFKGKKEIHNRRLTRVSRFFKAWRDYTWPKGGPSSIVLMVCVVEVFDNSKISFDRDCEAILAVSRKLPSLLNKKVLNPALSPDEDDEVMFPRGQTQAEVDEIVKKANELHSNIHHALILAKSNQEVVDKFRESFGPRIPNRCDLVGPVNSSTSSAVLSVAPTEQIRRKIPVTKSA